MKLSDIKMKFVSTKSFCTAHLVSYLLSYISCQVAILGNIEV